MNGTAQLLTLPQQEHKKGCHLVGMASVLTGGDLLHHGVLGVLHDFAPQVRGFDLYDVASILKDDYGLAH